MKRITLKDIAEEVGVSVMTVSLTLREQGKISQSLRERIKSKAKEMGYRPDPALSALMSYRFEQKKVSDYRTIAFVTHHPERDAWRDEVFSLRYYQGATSRAEALGYKIEPFWMLEPGMTATRAVSILETRGIKGLLIAPITVDTPILPIEWHRFCTVSLCRNLITPRINVVDHNHYQSMVESWSTLLGRGYSRIGYAVREQSEEMTGRQWLATHLMEQSRCNLSKSDIILPLISSNWTLAEFKEWLDCHSPDVVVSPHIEAYQWLKELGYRCPEDIGFLWLEACEGGEVSGVWQHFTSVGMTSVDLLHLELLRSAYGIPPIRQTVNIDGDWVEGKTLRNPV